MMPGTTCRGENLGVLTVWCVLCRKEGGAEVKEEPVEADRRQNFELVESKQNVGKVREDDEKEKEIEELKQKLELMSILMEQNQHDHVKERDQLFIQIEELCKEKLDLEDIYWSWQDLYLESDMNKKLVEELRSKVECPVCLVVPREGPVPQCPSGHFICVSCKETREEEGKQDCPSCRGPMVGEANSLLASVVIENIKHECKHDDCDEMVHYKERKSHEEQCEHRLVLCPGSGTTCSKLVPFKEMVGHVKGCKDNISKPFVFGEEQRFCLSNKYLNTDVTWDTNFLEFNAKTFFFKMKKEKKILTLELVLLGTQEEANKYFAEISISDPKNKIKSLKSCFEPRPIDQDKWGSACYTVTESVLAKLWNYNDKEYEFLVKVQITKDED
jgi:hypothetical protein